MPRRVLNGVVTGTKMDKTIVVNVERTAMHPLYKKFLKTSKKYHVHNENPEIKVGDKVAIIETKPFSKTVTFEVMKEGK